MADRTPPLSTEELGVLVDAGEIDTVVLAFTDMQGRLQGKRFAARYFLDTVLEHGTEGCNYLLAVDVDLNTVGGYEMSSWERGYGDFAMHGDAATLRRTPWNPGTALITADLAWHDRSPVVASPGRSCAASWTGSPSGAGARTPAPSWSSCSSRTPTKRAGPAATAR